MYTNNIMFKYNVYAYIYIYIYIYIMCIYNIICMLMFKYIMFV